MVLLMLGALVSYVRLGDRVRRMGAAMLALVFSVGYLAAQAAVAL